MKIALDIGHMGKTSNQLDRGVIYKGARESDYALLYAVATKGHLEKHGHIVYLLCHGNYSARHQFCLDYNIDLHMQCHLNAGKGQYGLIGMRKNNDGQELADIILAQWKECLPISKTVILPIVKNNGKRTRGWPCVMSEIPSLLLEPLFFDNDKHHELIVNGDACIRIGKAITKAILQWT